MIAYYGTMSFIINKDKVSKIPTSFEDILEGDYMVTISDPVTGTSSQCAVLSAAMAFGGGEDNLQPGILGIFSVTFANALAAYATGYALLTNNAMLLPVRVSEQFVGNLLPNKQFGSALAVVMMALMVIVTTITTLAQKRRIR